MIGQSNQNGLEYSSNQAEQNGNNNQSRFIQRKPIMISCSAAMLDKESEEKANSVGFDYTIG